MPRSTRIGPYRILRLINRGGQGSVYLGFDERLHRRVAIKIYRLPEDRRIRRSVLREARLVARIQSPKVVQIHDLIVASDHIALVMEYVPGCDLEEFLSLGTPSFASVIRITVDVVGAIATARQKDIVHGDLKASNVLITSQGRAKLTDFGIAMGNDEHEGGRGNAASLSCISPEHFLGKPLDVRSDLFALGCLIYRMLTGRHAFFHAGVFDGESLLNSMPTPVEELVPESMGVPVEMFSLVTSLLQKSPEHRPVNTHQVRSVLRSIARGMPLVVGNTLLEEAEPCFRKESAEDIPPIIPSDLTHNGRSGLGRFKLEWPVLTLRAVFGVALGAIALVVLIGSFLWQHVSLERPRVFVDAPSLTLALAAELPAELSSQWLEKALKEALSLHFGAVKFVDSKGLAENGTFYSQGVAPLLSPPEFRMSSELRCIEELCLLGLAVEHEGQRLTRQTVIFANMPLSQWQDIILNATQTLLSQHQ